MTTTTRQDIREQMLDTYQLGLRGTDDGTAQASITDAALLAGPGAAQRVEVGCELRTTAGGAADEEVRVSARPVQATGLTTVTPSFSGVTTTSTTFEILFRPLRFLDAHNAIAWALANIFWEKLLLPITLAVNGDFLIAGTTNWGNTSAAISKIPATFPYGLGELRVENSSANGYATNATANKIQVEAGETYYLEATVRCNVLPATNTAILVLRDLSNAANITLNESTTTNTDPTILSNTVTMPSGCQEVEIRLSGSEADADTQWSNVIFRKDDSKEFVVQDRAATVDRLGKLYATTSDVWGARGDTMYEVAHTLERRTVGLWVYKTTQNVSGRSLWYEEWRRPAALSTDAGTVSLDKEDVAAVATEHLLKTSGLRRRDDWQDVYEQAAIDAARVRAKYQSMERSYDFSPTTVVLAET